MDTVKFVEARRRMFAVTGENQKYSNRPPKSWDYVESM